MAIEFQDRLQWWLCSLLGALLFVALAVSAVGYGAFSVRYVYQKHQRAHAEASTIMRDHSGLKSIPFAKGFWDQTVATVHGGVLGPAIVDFVESSRLYQFITVRTWLAAGFFGGTSLFVLWLVVANASSIVFMLVKNKGRAQKRTERLSQRLEQVFTDPEIRKALASLPGPSGSAAAAGPIPGSAGLAT
jgi:hypothetical protein